MIDMQGKVCGRLTVLAYHMNGCWVCECTCGTQKIVCGSALRSGRQVSCGCRMRTVARETFTKHGHSGLAATPTYYSWKNMWRRCTNPKHPRYKDWGGRGITVCKRWRKFENFLADMGERPTNLTLDRRDNDGNYTPSNCRWATALEQRRNQRR